jgi:hypothetical protein
MAGSNGATQILSNLEYDLLTVLQNKSEALKAYETYMNDAQQTRHSAGCSGN